MRRLPMNEKEPCELWRQSSWKSCKSPMNPVSDDETKAVSRLHSMQWWCKLYCENEDNMTTYIWWKVLVHDLSWWWCSSIRGGRKSKLVHHPIGLYPFRSSASVENEWLLQAYAFTPIRGVNRPIGPGSFPKSRPCDPIRPRTVSVFTIPRAVEVPLFLPGRRQLCSTTKYLVTPSCNKNYLLKRRGEIKVSYLEGPMGRICRCRLA